MNYLIEQFKLAGLFLIILTTPIRSGRNMELIFQLDIQKVQKGNKRTEVFRIYPGKETSIQGINIDPDKKQLLLMIKEPRIEFETERVIQKKETVELITKNLSDRNIKFRVDKGKIYYIEKTPGRTRHFLAGVDERQLFIAELQESCSTVEQAHKVLGKTIQFSDGKRKGSSVDRQGEWFFLETDQITRSEIEKAIQKNLTVIQTHQNIGAKFGFPGGNSHMSDELVILPKSLNSSPGSKSIMRNRVFVKGKIRHIDHKTVKFSHWREVIKNNEPVSNSRMGANGLFWID